MLKPDAICQRFLPRNFILLRFLVRLCLSLSTVESLLILTILNSYAPNSSLRELSKNVILTVKVHLIAIHLNLGPTILGEKDSIASLESGSVKVARNVANARSDGNYLSLIGTLGLVRGEVDTTGGLSLLGRSSDQDPITEGGKGASEGLQS